MKKNKKQNKGNDNKVIYGILINKVEKNGKYVIPNMVKKSSSSKLSAYAPYAHKLMRKELIIISKKNNLKLFKTLSKIFNDKISYILVAKDIMDEAIDIVVNKKIKTFKLHTRLSLKEHYELIKKRREITTPAFFFIDSFTGPGSYSVRDIMRSSQYENIFNAAREFGNRYAEVNRDCSELLNPKVGKEDSSTASKKDARPIHTPIKIDKDKCTIKFNVRGFTEKDCSISELADKLNDSKIKWGDNISAEIKIASDELEMSLINKIAEILNSDCSASSSLIANDKVAMILHEVEHYKFQKDFKGDEINVTSIINPINSEMPKDDTASEVSEYLDNTGYDKIINNIKISISEKYMTEKIAGKHNFILPKDFRERLFDLSYLPDLENRFKQFSNIGILQQELLLKYKNKDMIESIGELTFAQVLELFTVLAGMKGMIKIKDEESGEYYLKHLEKKAELIVNDIKLADIENIKISKMGVMTLVPDDSRIGKFGTYSRKCNWELFNNLDDAISALSKITNEPKVYTLLKYQSLTSLAFSNIEPKDVLESFGQEYEVLLDTDTLFYFREELLFYSGNCIISCGPVESKNEHATNVKDKWAYHAIGITEQDIKTKINIEPLIPSQAQDRTKRARHTDIKVEAYPTTISAEEYEKSSKTPKGEANPLADNEAIEIIQQELTEPAIEPNMDDLLEHHEMLKFNIEEEENDELVFIICPKGGVGYDIVWKTKEELDSDENLNNYRAKFIGPETQLFNLIKNDLLNVNNALNLTREPINSVTKIYVPSHTVGLHYKITEDDSSNLTVEILFSYSQKSYDEFRGKLKYIAFKDFQDECKK